jgi:hypothetical protein
MGLFFSFLKINLKVWCTLMVLAQGFILIFRNVEIFKKELFLKETFFFFFER